MQISQSYARDVQLLLWAVGEARDRGRQRDRSTPVEEALPVDEAGFFTEWQPPPR